MKLEQLTTYQTTVMQAKAHRAIKTHMSQFLREHNLTMMQWAIVGALHAAGEKGMRVSDLAEQLDTSLAFITTTLNVLEGKNMIQRALHQQDSRAKVVSLRTDFAPKVAAIEKQLAEKIRNWLVPVVGRDELEVYVNVLDKIAKTVND